MPAKLTINDMKELAKEKQGTFVSKKYTGTKDQHEWKCKVPEHPKFTQRPDKVKAGRWCNICDGIIHRDNKNAIMIIKKFAERKGGKCLSTEYKDAKTNLDWQCDKCGHTFQATWSNVKNNSGEGEHGRSRGTWCGKCRDNAWNDIEKTVLKHHGEIVSKKVLTVVKEK